MNYQNSHRSSHIIANCSNITSPEIEIEKSKIDTGTQTSILNDNVKEFRDASTQTSFENPIYESNKVENIAYPHNILQNCEQNDSDSLPNEKKELTFDKLNLNVKTDKNDKSNMKQFRNDKIVTECSQRLHTKSLKHNLRRKRLANDVKHKSRNKKSRGLLKKSKRKSNCHRKANKTKHKDLKSHDSKRLRKKDLNDPSNPTNHEFSKIISFIPGTKMKEKATDDDCL
jgi:hypothetical protein